MTRPIPADLESALAKARAFGFLGPGPLEDHWASALAFDAGLDVVEASDPALDLGSGGGVPGLLLAVLRPHWTWTLVDANRRRMAFLHAVVDELGLAPRVQLERGRAEELGREPTWRGAFGTVTARSFGPPATAAECGGAFLRLSGWLLVADPPEPRPERWPPEGLAGLGLGAAMRVTEGPSIVAIERVAPVPAGVPRSWKAQQGAPWF